jgi:NADPH:quinone reductase-like Zn-dependent oxidoreductase
LIPGIDLAGTVEASSYPGIAVGDRVVANSWGLSQTHHGGYAQKARLKGEWLVKIPAPFSTNWLSTSLRLVDSGSRNGESGRRKNRGGRVPWPTSC